MDVLYPAPVYAISSCTRLMVSILIEFFGFNRAESFSERQISRTEFILVLGYDAKAFIVPIGRLVSLLPTQIFSSIQPF